MALFVMQDIHGIILCVWIISVLTLSKSDTVETDGTASSNTTSVHVLSRNEHQTLPSSINSTFQSYNSTKTSNNNIAAPLVAGEGGPILIPSTTQDATSTFHPASISGSGQNNLLKEEESTRSTGNRKNTKIVSRKGANEMLNIKEENVTNIEVASSNDTKLSAESSSIASISRNNENNLKSNNSVNVTQEKLAKATTVTASSVQEHRPKPTATVVGPNSDKRAFISHTKGLHLGMSKKIDYVLPVIVTLIALPILGAIMFMIYKQGRDCWDKRHYRRMDFLIDGMYND